METVQLQCGSCNKLMAISTQHLGSQVRCPHCQAVVQTPQPAEASAPLEIHAPQVEAGEAESIFTPPAPSEDLFDAPQGPLVEMPPDAGPSPPPNNAVTVEVPMPILHDGAARPAPPEARHGPATDGDADLAAFKRPRPPVDRGYVSLLLLIFLVPYSIMMTLFVIYLWYQLMNQAGSLELLPDPAPKKDGARQVERAKHDQPLTRHQLVPLGRTLRIGDMEITPRRVQRDEFGDLSLVLNAKNISNNQAFSPVHPDFVKVGKGTTMPYTFVETKSFQRLYGGQPPAFDRGGNGLTTEGDLLPGQAEDVILTTFGNKDVVRQILDSNEDVTWRIQVRRGLVANGAGHRISATAVIGVVFKPSDVGKLTPP
jgi:phage FluMu protein Com